MTPKSPSFRSGFFTLALWVALSLTSTVWSQSSPEKKSIDVPAGDAIATLRDFSTQAGGRLLYSADAVSGIQTRAVKGIFAPSDALELMLADTGLIAVKDSKSGAIAIRKLTPEELKNAPRALANNSDRPNEKTEVARTEDGAVKLDTFEVFGKKSLNMDVKRSQDDIQPYVVYDQKAIQASGVTTLEAFLMKSVTSASMGPEFAQTPNVVGVISTGIRLRGLSANETLILVDGRRLAQTGSTTGLFLSQADLNGIPLSAIERIDVLPTSASGIYGGNATGGVINIILRRDYAAVQLSLTYGNAFDTDVNYRRIELNGGYNFEKGRTNLMFALSASDGGELWTQDRDFRDRYFAVNRANLPPSNSSSVDGILTAGTIPVGTTANIRSTNGQNLTLKSAFGGGFLNSPITSVPTGYAGPASDNGAGLIAAAGKYNYEFAPLTGSGGAVLRHTSDQTNYLMTLRREMSPWLSLFLDASGSRTTSTSFNGGHTRTMSLLATDQGNPFNQPITVQVPGYGTEGINEYRQTAMRISGGAIIKLPGDWNLGLDYTREENSGATTAAKVVNVRGSGGLNPAVAAGIVNVFRDEKLYPSDYAPYFFSVLPETTPVEVESNSASVRVSGPLRILPSWHPVQIATSVEYVDQSMGEIRWTNPNSGTGIIQRTFFPGASQSSNSIYTEFKWPLIISEQNVPAIKRFEIFAAGRYDSYRLHSINPSSVPGLDANWVLPSFSQSTVKLDASTPMFGFVYQPTRDISIRANYAEGFLPPTVFQLAPDSPVIGSTLFVTQQIKDMQRGNEPVGPVDLALGGNPTIRPETSESWSAGAIFTPRAIKGLRLSADWTRIDKTDAITSILPLPQAAFDQFSQAFPERITRAMPSDGFPVGKITAVQAGLVNFARVMVEAVDLAADYELPTVNYGTFTFSAKATRNIHVIEQLSPTAAQAENVGANSFNGYMPKWRGIASLTWERRHWTMGVSSQYYSSTYYGIGNHAIVAQLNTDRFPAQAYFDVFVRYATGPNARLAWLRNMEVSLNVNNVFNTKPPVSQFAPYYLNSMGDARLANYLISVRKTF